LVKKKVFGQFLGTKQDVTGLLIFCSTFLLKMKDLEGGKRV
jgi:hypothetical protein